MATIELKGIRKTYAGAGAEAIRGIDLAIEDGEFVVILGPSGCGKSTLLRIVAGLETPSGGELLISGAPAIDLDPKDRNLAMVFQNYALYPHMTVRNNMAYALKLRGLPRSEIERRVRNAAGILGLEEFLDRKPRQLSGGQRQRVAMGRAIVREPAAFLFDEPLSNLDAKLRVQMRAEIKALQRRLGVTSLYVTHDQVEAMTLADRIVVMNGGRIEQVAAPLDIYQRPASHFVAAFTGSPAMNLVTGRLEGGTAIRLRDGQSLPLRERAFGERSSIVFGIRPENVILAAEPPSLGGLAAEVAMVEALGADTIIHLSCGPDLLTARLNGAPNCRIGERLWVSWQPGALHLFDAETGAKLNQHPAHESNGIGSLRSVS
jgi:sn-glycerol 3-phosphate transport system ATP-binding protein